MERYDHSINSKLKSIDDILHRISCMDQAEDEAELSQMTPDLLQSIGAYADADRVYIFEWASESQKSIRNTFEWCAPGITPEIENLQNVPVEMVPVWMEAFHAGRNIVIDNLEDVAQTMPNEYTILKPQTIRSLIAVPVFAGRALKGFIGIDNPDVYSDTLSLRILSDVGGHLGSIQENMRMLQVLKAERESLRRRNLVLSGLSLDYSAILTVNLDTGNYEIVSNLARSDRVQNTRPNQGGSAFDAFGEWYAGKFVLPEFRNEILREWRTDTIRKRFEVESDYHFSYEALPNDAGQSCFQAHIVKKYDSEGHFAILGLRCVDDVVAKERHYQQLLQNQLDMISFALPGGVKISRDDRLYTFQYVSEPFSRMLGYDSPEELVKAANGSIAGLAHPDDLARCYRQLDEQYSRQDHYVLNYRVRCKDGSYMYIEDRGKRVTAEDGAVEHWSLILDKNDLMEKTIALESEKKANRSKSAFLSRMSHDMRTPLNGIVGLLKIDAAHPEDRALVDANREKMQVAADHLLSLINDVLQMSKIESGTVTLTREAVDLQSLFQDICKIMEERAGDQGIVLEFRQKRPDAPIPPCIYGSPLHLRQIFLNIYGNAVKYNRYGGKIVTTADYSEKDGITTCCWEIRDTGVGMKQEFLEHIFEPFTQEKQDARSVYQGTGLGMSIVKGLVDQMHGTITVSSEEGVGTTFVVTIPFETARKAEPVPEHKPEMGNLKGVRLLLAEDNALNAEIAQVLLRDEGAEVTTVSNGQEAVELFQKEPKGTFDLIFMDIMMPIMDGLTATKIIRAMERPDAKTIPILAMTANAFAEDRETCLAAGMDDHLTKPLNIDAIKRTVCRYLHRN